MRIRNAVIAGASAVAVAFAGTTVASAEETAATPSLSSQLREANNTGVYEGQEGQSETTLSSKIGSWIGDKEDPANPISLFGSSKNGSEEAADGDFSSQPVWAQIFYGLGVGAAVATFVGMIAGPLDNFIKYGPLS